MTVKIENREVGGRAESKLNGFDATRLIPDKFRAGNIIVGEAKVITKAGHGDVEYVIRDEKKGRLRDFRDFTYFEEDDFDKYPELKAGNNLYYRPLVHGHISEISPTILFGGMAETNPVLRGKGFGVAFFENLYTVAKQLGYKFFGGYHNDAEVARFFLNRGHFLIEEIKDEFQKEFDCLREEQPDDDVYFTVKILNPDDIERYVRRERVDASIEDRIAYKQKIIALDIIFSKSEKLIQKLETTKHQAGDASTAIEVLEDLNSLLPEQEQYNLKQLSEDDDDLTNSLRNLLTHLKSRYASLAHNASLDEIEDNIVE